MARAIWKGTLGFGLVTIGVELEPVEAPERLDLDLLDRRDMGRIGYQKINKNTGRPVEPADIVRGYPVTPNHYVVLTDEEIKAANPKTTRRIDVLGFTPRDAISPIFFAKPYFVSPVKGSEKAYVLFRDTLRTSERIAVAQLVLHTRQYVAAIYPDGDLLVAQMLRYASEMRKAGGGDRAELKAATRSVRPAERQMAEKLMEAMDMTWRPGDYRDTFRDDILRLVKQRASRRGTKTSREPAKPEHEPKVLDLMAALQKSLPQRARAGAQKKRGHAPSRRTA